MNTLELLDYYANLLILQYVGLERARSTIKATVKPFLMPQQSQQLITFSPAPTGGTFTLTYGEETTAPLNWNATANDIQTALRLFDGFDDILVTGSISGGLTVDFVNVPPIVELLEVTDNELVSSGDTVIPVVTQTDQTLPLSVQDAFDPATAAGVQLDVIGKYQGITRYGYGFGGAPIVLDDEDFHTFISFATIRNNAGSSLATIQALMHQFFPNQVFVFDFVNMHMGYFIDTALGSVDLLELMVVQGLLPKPMGVELAATIYSPDIANLFGFRTYELPPYNNTGFNDYDDYNMQAPWLNYNMAIAP